MKNPLHCKTCVLVPPNRMAPPPTTRERPVGCRTIFVGGLPENVTGKEYVFHQKLPLNHLKECLMYCYEYFSYLNDTFFRGNCTGRV